MDLGLKDKRALVTGSSRGLGFATARTLLSEGARVVINARQADQLAKVAAALLEEFPERVFAFPGDMSDPSVPEKAVNFTIEMLGGIDILVANAGGPPPGAFENMDDGIWQNALNLSFLSQVRLIRAALPALRLSPAPSVLAVASYSVKQPIPNMVLSNSVRLATIGMIKTLALESGKDGIRFNAILPGWTETERVVNLMENRAKLENSTSEEEIKKQAAEIALGRIATPQEFANVAAFLVSPAASYVTGVMMGVDGGIVKGTF